MFVIYIYIYIQRERGARGVMVIVIGNGHATRVQILDETDCISHSTYTLGKGMNPIILPPAMGKQQGRLGSSALVRQLVQDKENSEFKLVKLRLKIDLVSYPARVEGLGKYIYPLNILLYIYNKIFRGYIFMYDNMPMFRYFVKHLQRDVKYFNITLTLVLQKK